MEEELNRRWTPMNADVSSDRNPHRRESASIGGKFFCWLPRRQVVGIENPRVFSKASSFSRRRQVVARVHELLRHWLIGRRTCAQHERWESPRKGARSHEKFFRDSLCLLVASLSGLQVSRGRADGARPQFSVAQIILWERSLTAICSIYFRRNFEAERNRRRRLPQIVI